MKHTRASSDKDAGHAHELGKNGWIEWGCVLVGSYEESLDMIVEFPVMISSFHTLSTVKKAKAKLKDAYREIILRSTRS